TRPVKEIARSPVKVSRGRHNIWVRELRAPFLLLPAIFVPVGLLMAWSQGSFNPLYAVLTMAGAVSLHASVDVLNDYFDFTWGIGELVTGINFGPLLLLGTYYVQTRTLAIQPLLVGAVLGILTAGILYINEFPDVDADSSRGRRDLVVRWGKQAAASRFKVLLASAYVILVLGVASGLITALALLGLLVIPKARSAARILDSTNGKAPE